MTFPQYPQRMSPAQQYEPAPTPPSNGVGIASLILGIISFLIAFIPFVGIAGIITGLLAVIFGIVALVKGQIKALAIVGTVLGAVSLAIAIGVTYLTYLGISMVGNAISSASADMSKPHEVRYVVTAQTKAKVTYSSGTGTSNDEVTGTWEKNAEFTRYQSFSISVRDSQPTETGKVTCEIFVDGQSVSKNSGLGSIQCSGSVPGR